MSKKTALQWYHDNKDTPIMRQRRLDRMTSYKSRSGYTLKGRSHDKKRDAQRYDPLVNWGSSKGICRQAGSCFMRCHQ